MSWARAVGGLDRPFAYHHRVLQHAGLALVGLPLWLAHGPSGAQGLLQFTTQFATALDVGAI